MKALDQFPEHCRKKISHVLTDIDGTITCKGRLPSRVFGAMERLREAGIHVIPITGRPAGWCDHIARMWPVDGIVGENGALYFWFDEEERRLKKRFFESKDIRTDKRLRLKKIQKEILASVPGSAVASDQRYRETDLAIDYCEDVSPLGIRAVDRICDIFKKYSATYKVSSIHVNGWFGNYDKLKMTKIFIQEQWGLDLDTNKDRFVFCGDSPNDEPMFKYFPYSVGVKNVLNFTDRMKHLPTFVAGMEEGDGFIELVDTLLA